MKAGCGTRLILPVVAAADADAAAEEAIWGAAVAVVVGVEAEVVGGGDPASGPIYLSVPYANAPIVAVQVTEHIFGTDCAVDLSTTMIL